MPDEDETFLREFEAGRWPLDQWHHRDHVKLAYLYLRRYEFDEAMTHLRAGIQAHHAAHGVPESLTSGYHETTTRAWLTLIDVVLREYWSAVSADAFFEQHPELWRTKVLRLFYSRERFTSAEAKAGFVEPDLAGLPRRAGGLTGDVGRTV